MQWVVFLTWLLAAAVVGATPKSTFDEPYAKIRNMILEGGRPFVYDLCKNLTEMHNEIKIGEMSQTNREFLNLAGQYGSSIEGPGRFIVSNFECKEAITNAKNRKAKKWMRNFTGSHTGTL